MTKGKKIVNKQDVQIYKKFNKIFVRDFEKNVKEFEESTKDLRYTPLKRRLLPIRLS